VRPLKTAKGMLPGMGLVFTDLSADAAARVSMIVRANNPEKHARPEIFVPVRGAEEEKEPADPPPARRNSALVLGIDLGTTYSCAALVQSDRTPVVVPSDTGFHSLPSVVTIRDNHLVGRAAAAMMSTYPKQTIHSHKRIMGRRYNSPVVQELKKRVAYEIVADQEGDAAVQVDGEVYSLTWVSSLILKELVTWAEHFTGEKINKAIITVPAYYTDRQRQAVLQAGRMAGLKVLQLLNEPTGAALAFGIDRGFHKKILVYDLGGGTLDVSVLQLNGNVFEVLTSGGDPYLGGLDFDHKLAGWIMEEFKKQHGVDLSEDLVVRTRILQAAEVAKRDLSELSEARVSLPYVARQSNEALSLDKVVTRERFNLLVRELVDRTVEVCEQTLKAARISREEIDQLIMVGGQTNTPLVQGTVRSYFKRVPQRAVHPEEAIAIGAALLGDHAGTVEAVVLLDVASSPVGIALPDGRMKALIAKDSRLPAVKEHTLATTADGQTSIDIHVYQGVAAMAAENDYLGTVRVVDLPARPAGTAKVDLQLELDRHGFLQVSVRGAGSRYQVARMITHDAPREGVEVIPPIARES